MDSSALRKTNLGMVGSIRWLVDAKAITTHFQPIFSVPQRAVVGMEALARGNAADGSLIPPVTLFKLAEAERLSGAVEDLCRWSAIRRFAGLTHRTTELLLFLNLDLVASPSPEALLSHLESLVRAAGIKPRNVAVEFLEARLDDVGRFGSLATALRKRGFLVVLDDVGAGHSNLDRIPLFRPDIIKIDRSLVTGVESDFYKQETFKSLVSLCRRIGALVVAEGIETEAEAIAALTLGADLLQGYHLGRPQDAGAFEGDGFERAAGRAGDLAQAFKNHMVGAINDRAHRFRSFSGILGRILGELTAADVAQYDAILDRVIGEDSRIQCCYVLDDEGIQVTETVGNAGRDLRSSAAMFRPAPRGTDHSLKEYYYVLVDVELQKYTTDPYVSLASGTLCRTISTRFAGAGAARSHILCVDVYP
jgi:EAL domain-containing protein (putative c-di-GMP-specific phosphodiesterase class I)